MKTSYLQSSLLAMITATVVAGACMDPGPPSEPLIRATATIEDNLPADGCSIVVRVDGIEYAPDAYSRDAILARKLGSMATVAIRYRVTGGTGKIECPRGALSRPEIAFVFDE
jgi:hypothetical protein